MALKSDINYDITKPIKNEHNSNNPQYQIIFSADQWQNMIETEMMFMIQDADNYKKAGNYLLSHLCLELTNPESRLTFDL
jgi:hypothetical protein